MKAVIQRVTRGKVTIEGKVHGEIGRGFVVLLGVAKDDTKEDMDYLVKKISGLRVFEDTEGKMNLGLKDVNGELLIISQFTLFANTKKGNRPSFVDAGLPEPSKAFYLEFIQAFRSLGFNVGEGEFGADMAVELVNDGPVTIIIDSKNR
ncbi:MAG: D-aminoacyl-tRNA deacylase [Frisingicoccus sp.]|uniref:D-aminoacyl-tRNA deacylase n=1 Tax=Frisingicoccus sp. TaxID=1918627 RepID=UPI002620F30B|nr:D-aminoacyl-tRNA deacylase [Frisingicoccus sp.]MDD6231869.1 D-aminoacyl-tRNA deacylase [Frisingicoccus sp.]